MITILIPTLNRSGFLIRQLNYYRKIGFKGYICIGDSSNSEHLGRLKKALPSLQSSLNIIYREYPGLSDPVVMKLLVDLGVTPYAAYAGDDDFLIPSALEQCQTYLEGHPECSAVHGIARVIKLRSDRPDSKISWVRNYQQTVVEGETASQRLNTYFSDYGATMFSVHHIESWRKMYQYTALLPDRTFAGELLPSCLSVVLGKVKELDCLYLVRPSHNQVYSLPEKQIWLNDPNWHGWYETFCSSVSKELSRVDKISMNEAENVVRNAFQVYLDSLTVKPAQTMRGMSRLKKIAGLVPGVSRAWNALQPAGREEVRLLKELLQPFSPYHGDFMPVFSAITAESYDSPMESSL
jgi:glycosyltransferase domain-containing protein